MKKCIVLAAAAFSFGLASAPQVAAQGTMVGLKAGFVLADVSIEDLDTSSRTGYGFGPFLQVMVGPSFSIQPELLYLAKGFEASDDEEGGDFIVKTRYLQLPILIQYHIPTAGPVSPRLFVGPSIAFETGCDVEAIFGSVSAEDDCETADINTKSADFGVVLGGGVDIPAGGVVVTIDGRYDLGVTDINDDGTDIGAKNRAWEVFAGIGVPVGL